MPAARPHLVAETQRVMQPMALARPGWFLAAGNDVVPASTSVKPPRALRIAQIIGHEDVADEAVHLRGDVGVTSVHIEAVHANAAGQLMVDQGRLCGIGHVVDPEPAIPIRLLFRRLDRSEIRFGDIELLRQLAMRMRRVQSFAQLAPYRRQLLGAPSRSALDCARGSRPSRRRRRAPYGYVTSDRRASSSPQDADFSGRRYRRSMCRG